MSAQRSPDELRTLLLGEGSHARANAPEPDLLVGLAEVLPHDLVQLALYGVALGAGLPRDSLLRDRVLTALATRVAASPEHYSPDALLPVIAEVGPFLPREVAEHVGAEPPARADDEPKTRPLRSPDVDPAVAKIVAAVISYLRRLPETERYDILAPVIHRIAEKLGGLGETHRLSLDLPEPMLAYDRPADVAPGAGPGTGAGDEQGVGAGGGGDWDSGGASGGAGEGGASGRGGARRAGRGRSASTRRGTSGREPSTRRTSRQSRAWKGAARERVVNTGFAATARPSRLLSPDLPLEREHDYWFCFEIGPPLAHSAEPERTVLPIEHLPPKARLVVALFAFVNELELDAEHDTGQLQLNKNGTVFVTKRAATPLGVTSDLLRKQLFFPVKTPKTSGDFRLRCNIYCQGVLVQSRLVQARVRQVLRRSPHALRTRLEYALSRAIGDTELAFQPHHKLSLMLNGPGDGTHVFRVFADDGREVIKTDSRFEGQELTDLINDARTSMRTVAWGDGDEWSKGKPFRYTADGGVNLERLRNDMALLAIHGYRIYVNIVNELRGTQSADSFEQHMSEPGYVQLAAQDGRMLVPLALVYDYSPFDDTADLRDYTLCQVFRETVKSGSLDSFTCLNGRCPSRGSDTVVCPSGFWGYRHFLGLPLSSALDVPPVLATDRTRRIVFGAASALDDVIDHENELRPFATEFESRSSRREFLAQLRSIRPHLVYLYCHGGLDKTQPFVLVGSGKDGPLTRAYLYRRVSWTDPRPLVVINGCHTTAVRPDQAFDLVTAFVEQAHASGVIGTEITVVESLARDFGREFVRRLSLGNETVGQAVRGARLSVLEHGNPLGLVYIPFALAGLRLDPIAAK